MKVTLKQIADMAGVHRSTVDKVLHGRVGVSDEVRQKVQSIINELGYVPNPAGRVLQKQGRIFRIAAVLVDVDALPFLREGIEQGVREQVGFDIRIDYYITKFQDVQGQAAILRQLIGDQVDGIILSPVNADRVRAAIDAAVDAGIPVVTTNADIDVSKRLCCVGMDVHRDSRIAGRLMGQFVGGCGQIAIVSSAIDEENNNYYVSVRDRAFARFITENYPEIEIVERVESFEDPEITYKKTCALLARYPALKGLYITCGGAAEVGRALKEDGRARQIRVLSFEDYPQILSLMREDVIDCTLASDLQRQGAWPVKIIMDRLVFGIEPDAAQQFTELQILVKESLPDA